MHLSSLPLARARRRTGLVALLAGLLVAATVPAVATAATSVNYVNMGDSYSAGSGVAPPSTAPPQCTQSALNWGHDLATTHGYQLTDVSCGGAQTKDYRTAQFPGVSPQLAALSRSTQLVTMTIGGNDNNVFIDLITKCGAAAVGTLGQGNPCEKTYGKSFENTINRSTYPNVVQALRDVRAKAPNARVAIAGYLQILPPTMGCYPFMPVATGDVPYLNRIQKALNSAVQRAASQTGVTYIDVTQASQGHDACQLPGTRWIEPAIGGTNTVPVHPNALGEQAMADRATAVLGLR